MITRNAARVTKKNVPKIAIKNKRIAPAFDTLYMLYTSDSQLSDDSMKMKVAIKESRKEFSMVPPLSNLSLYSTNKMIAAVQTEKKPNARMDEMSVKS